VIADRYRIDALLGEGGMGRVYSAEHVLMRKRLAVKVLHRELTSVPDVVARFEREAMAAANIDHPNVAAATDFGKLADGSVFLVLEYVEGKNLRDEIAKGPFAVERAVRIARQIASALGSAHQLSIVHRDLKPENVMLVQKGSEADFVKVLDFGIAKVPIGEGPEAPGGKALTKVGMVFGTPEYMAPEQALGQPVDGRADLYALGVIFYEMLAGIRPYSSSSQAGILGQQLSQPIPPFAERAPGVQVPPSVEQVVQRLLARDAADRYQKAEDVVIALDAVLGMPLAGAPRIFTQLGGSNSVRLTPQSHANPMTSAADAQGSGDPLTAGSDPQGPRHGLSAYGETLPAPEELSTALRAAPNTPPHGSLAAPPAWARAGRQWPAPIERALDFIQARQPRWPSPLRSVPPLGLLAGGAGLTLAALAVIIGFAVSGESPARSGDAATSATPGVQASAASVRAGDAKEPAVTAAGPTESELDAAEAQGLSALESLRQRFPTDADVLLRLVRVHSRDGKHADILKTVREIARVAPNRTGDPIAVEALTAVAGTPAQLTPVLDLATKELGAGGVDIVYSLLTAKDAKPEAKEAARKALAVPEFRKLAAPPVAIALDLYDAKTPEDVAGLLERTTEVGDRRSIERLRFYEQKQICTKVRRRNKCTRFAPFLDGKTLTKVRETIATLEKRAAASATKP
jgi:serine/threonine-protein kinase